jgi:hypothetical protein
MPSEFDELLCSCQSFRSGFYSGLMERENRP